jgi:hypothetical protein
VLGLYRIAIGLLTIYSFALFAKDAAVFFSDDGVFTTRTLQSTLGRECHTLLKWVGSPVGVRIALGALYAAGLAFTVGYCTRISSVALYILVVSFHERNNLVLNGGDTVLRTMLFFFMFAPSGAACSVGSLLRRLRAPGAQPLLISPWAQRMMQVQVALIYLTTAYAKTRGALYHDGTAMYYVFGLVDFNVRGVEQLMNYPLIYSSLTYAVLLVELSLPFLLWFRASRPYAVAMGLLAHGWIMLFMTIPVFGLLMVATYLPFFTEAELSAALDRVRRRFERRRATVYFDGRCPTWLTALDVFGRMDAREGELPLGETVLVTPGGRVLRGFDAYRWLLPRLPALSWSWPLWFLPGVAWAGRRIARGQAPPDSRDVDVAGGEAIP